MISLASFKKFFYREPKKQWYPKHRHIDDLGMYDPDYYSYMKDEVKV